MTAKPVILCVDDEKDILDSLRSLLLLEFKDQYRIELAESAAEALEIVRDCTEEKAEIPLTITDYIMPQMKGDELLILLHREFPTMIKILLTGQATLNGVTNAFENAHLYRYIEKPWEKNDFLLTLKEALKSYHTQQELSMYHKHLEELVNERTREIQEKNRHIMESIEYASVIQQSILPEEQEMAARLGDYFVIWHPMQVVGGDFYWFKKLKTGLLIGVIDCTGHGVPGACMTMLGYSVLNQIVSHTCCDDPARILGEMNRAIKLLLKQEARGSLSDDGMDAGFCYIPEDGKTLTYAGARIPLYYCQAGRCREIPGDNRSLGYTHSPGDYQFSNHALPLLGDETFFLASDGFLEQPGGAKQFSFSKQRFKSLLETLYREKAATQKQRLEEELAAYRGDSPLRDDITVIGFRL